MHMTVKFILIFIEGNINPHIHRPCLTNQFIQKLGSISSFLCNIWYSIAWQNIDVNCVKNKNMLCELWIQQQKNETNVYCSFCKPDGEKKMIAGNYASTYDSSGSSFVQHIIVQYLLNNFKGSEHNYKKMLLLKLIVDMECDFCHLLENLQLILIRTDLFICMFDDLFNLTHM